MVQFLYGGPQIVHSSYSLLFKGILWYEDWRWRLDGAATSEKRFSRLSPWVEGLQNGESDTSVSAQVVNGSAPQDWRGGFNNDPRVVWQGKPWDTGYPCDPWWPAVVVLGCIPALYHQPCFCTCCLSFYAPTHSPDTHMHGPAKSLPLRFQRFPAEGNKRWLMELDIKRCHKTGLFFFL